MSAKPRTDPGERVTISMWRRAQILGCTVLAILLLGLVCHGVRKDNTARFAERRRLRTDDSTDEVARKSREPFPNIMFVKPHKIGGSTMGGIVRRIMSRHGGLPEEYTHRLRKEKFFAKEWNQVVAEPEGRVHMWSNHLDCEHLYKHSNKTVLDQAFKFTITRNPVDRCLSQFYYDGKSGSREAMREAGIEPGVAYHPDPSGTDPMAKAKLKYIPKCMVDSVYPYVRCTQEQTMEEVLDFYQVVGSTERWVDTVAILKMKLGLDYGDILHLSSKLNNGRPSAAGGKVTADGIGRPPISEEPKRVIDAIQSYDQTKDDMDFWNMANSKMDQQIAELTAAGFPEVRAKVESLLRELKEVCSDERNNPPYTEEEKMEWLRTRRGEKYNYLFFIDCYWYDNGCGRKCMDKFAEDRGLNTA